jgi:hypothetical protein
MFTHGGDEKCEQKFRWNSLIERDHSEDVRGVDEKKILKWI